MEGQELQAQDPGEAFEAVELQPLVVVDVEPAALGDGHERLGVQPPAGHGDTGDAGGHRGNGGDTCGRKGKCRDMWRQLGMRAGWGDMRGHMGTWGE